MMVMAPPAQYGFCRGTTGYNLFHELWRRGQGAPGTCCDGGSSSITLRYLFEPGAVSSAAILAAARVAVRGAAVAQVAYPTLWRELMPAPTAVLQTALSCCSPRPTYALRPATREQGSECGQR